MKAANETPPAEPVVSGSPLKGGEEFCNPQLLLLLVPVPVPVPLPDSLPEKTLGRLGFRRSKHQSPDGHGHGRGHGHVENAGTAEPFRVALIEAVVS